jgi:hypothetical protein
MDSLAPPSNYHEYNNAPPHFISASNHTYANAEVSHIGDFRPFSPLYVNSDDESMRELLSEKGSHHGSRSREGRGWSVGSSHGDKVHGNIPREGRGWSVGSQKNQVIGYHVGEGRGASAGPAHVDRVQASPARHDRGCSVGSAHLERVSSQKSKEKRNWFGKRGDKAAQTEPAEDSREASMDASHESKASSQHRQYMRLGRARSVSAAARFKIDQKPTELPRPRSYSNNLSTVLSKPLPLPPFSVPPPTPHLKRSNPQLTSRSVPPPSHSPPPPSLTPPERKPKFDVSGDYTAPVPVAERYKYDPRLRHEMTSMQGQSAFLDRSHDYSDPDEADEEVMVSGKYDHLSPQEADVHPERHSQAFSDFQGLVEDDIEPPAIYSRGYVPTEVCTLVVE